MTSPAPAFDVSKWTAFIGDLVEAGGPGPQEGATLMAHLDEIRSAWRCGLIGASEMGELRQAFGAALSPATMQGRSFLKRHGYPGDFEIIDQIYQQVTSGDPSLRRWDEFFHAHGAAKAVRNRKVYFGAALDELSRSGNRVDVLNVASGPCRDLAEFFESHPSANIHLTCVDQDANAIAHGQELCRRWLDRVEFVQANAFRFRTNARFDLVWSAGLFDYFDDRRFAVLLSKLLSLAREGGEVVVGNFNEGNPSAAYQEICGDWPLNYRSAASLLDVARACGVPDEAIRVESEPERINLFLRIRC
ncbi:class I SAM-dependent methyltransferase [Variovorax sp. J2P1-59]|uniref:class I SAM-dependent methyltransferase n=1 Tax=Variovorax flavidus TaxID=3053501 RepID=UPI0025791C3A|nr:class I SAM-dependent methyltransferase [Variovorax sp. J2P1-59]MDM0072781.1 class I SAM-dependent methyltransferase [Variovorax sp. J2P1-59]